MSIKVEENINLFMSYFKNLSSNFSHNLILYKFIVSEIKISMYLIVISITQVLELLEKLLLLRKN